MHHTHQLLRQAFFDNLRLACRWYFSSKPAQLRVLRRPPDAPVLGGSPCFSPWTPLRVSVAKAPGRAQSALALCQIRHRGAQGATTTEFGRTLRTRLIHANPATTGCWQERNASGAVHRRSAPSARTAVAPSDPSGGGTARGGVSTGRQHRRWPALHTTCCGRSSC